MRSLIDMAADRGAFIDQSQSLNLFVASPTIGKLSSMYLHAWKRGLKTTYYLRSRPATRIATTTTGGAARSATAPASTAPTAPSRRRRARAVDDERRGGVLPREPRDLRGLRLMAMPHRPARAPVPARRPDRRRPPTSAPARRTPARPLLDPGLDLTLRPDALPALVRAGTGTPSATRGRSRRSTSPTTSATSTARLLPAEKHLVRRLVAFFATGDSIVANNLVLNLYKHINAPEARLYLSRQLFEEALHVQFYLTLLDTYLADDDERAEAFAAVENVPSIRAKAEFCFRWIDSLGDLDEPARPTRTGGRSCSTWCASRPASRGCSSSPPSPTCTSSARRASSTASPPAPTGCSATRAPTWPSPST